MSKRPAQESFAVSNSKKSALDLVQNTSPVLNSLDMKHLGGENFVCVNHFVGQTRVHLRRHVLDKHGMLQPTRDGVSLSPQVWHALRKKLYAILNHGSHDELFVIKKDVCISKQIKDGVEVFIFQRIFQRKNFTMQIVPEHILLSKTELEKLHSLSNEITDRLQDGLISYSVCYFIEKELKNPNLLLQPKDNLNGFLELLESLTNCLTSAIALKISELLICPGCRDGYTVSFMHDCVNVSRSEKWSEFFECALYTIDLNDLAKNIVQKNLSLDFSLILGEQEFFDTIDVKKIFECIKKEYIDEEQTVFNELSISSN